jgi:kynurenine formamidase
VPLVDLSAPIRSSPPETPDLLRTEIAFHDHAEGARGIEALFGVPARLLRDGEGWAVEEFLRFGTHNSTHVDAPYHYNSTIQGEPAQTIDQLPLDLFYGPGVVLDFTHKEDGDPVTAAEIEATGMPIEAGTIVLVHTGRDAFLDAPDYMARGCGVTAEATRHLFDRGVRVMGIDAWGWDAPLHLQARRALDEDAEGVFWEAHQANLPYCQIERLTGLAALPSTGFMVACFPLPIVGASGAPARVVAIVPDP